MKTIWGICLLSILTLSQPTQAATITYTFVGFLNGPLGTIPGDTTFAGSFSYDSETPDRLGTGNSTSGLFHLERFELYVDGDFIQMSGLAGTLTVANHLSFDQLTTQHFPSLTRGTGGTVAGGVLGGIDFLAAGQFDLVLLDNSASVFVSDALPDWTLTLGNFPDFSKLFFANNGSFVTTGDIALFGGSVVPLPGAAWMFGGALAGLGFARRKRILVGAGRADEDTPAKRERRNLSRVMSTALIFAFAGAAHAATIRYDFGGTLSGPIGTLAGGTAFSGSFTYASDARAVEAISHSFYLESFELFIGADFIRFSGPGGWLNVSNGSIDQLTTRHYSSGIGELADPPSSVSGGVLGGISFVARSVFTIGLTDGTGTALASHALPDSTLTLANFPTEARLFISNDASGLGAHTLTYFQGSVVPVPAALWMFTAGLGSLGLIRRRTG